MTSLLIASSGVGSSLRNFANDSDGSMYVGRLTRPDAGTGIGGGEENVTIVGLVDAGFAGTEIAGFGGARRCFGTLLIFLNMRRSTRAREIMRAKLLAAETVDFLLALDSDEGEFCSVEGKCATTDRLSRDFSALSTTTGVAEAYSLFRSSSAIKVSPPPTRGLKRGPTGPSWVSSFLSCPAHGDDGGGGGGKNGDSG